MDCPNGEDLGLYQTDDLEGNERQRVEDHLSNCEPCSSVVAQLRQAQTALQSDLPSVDQQRWDEFEKTLLTRVRAEKSNDRRGRSTRRHRLVLKKGRGHSTVFRFGMVVSAVAAAAIVLASVLSIGPSDSAGPQDKQDMRASPAPTKPDGGTPKITSHDDRVSDPVVSDEGEGQRVPQVADTTGSEESPAAKSEDQKAAEAGVDTESRQAAASTGETDNEQRGVSIAFLGAVEGKVEYGRGDGDRWYPAASGTPLVTGDRVRTKFSRAMVEFESGTKLHVNRFTTLAILDRLTPASLSVIGGEIYVETVAADVGFSVVTPHGTAVDLGTRFGVGVKINGTTVFVTQGSVEGSTDEGTVVVNENQETLLARRTAPPSEAREVRNVEKRIAWTFGYKPANKESAPADWASSWTHNGTEGFPKIQEEYRGRRDAWSTHPLDPGTPFEWTRSFELAEGLRHILSMDVTTHLYDREVVSDWELAVIVDGEEVFTKLIDKPVWQTVRVDLSMFAGQTIELKLLNRAGGKDPWRNEHGYWDAVRIISH